MNEELLCRIKLSNGDTVYTDAYGMQELKRCKFERSVNLNLYEKHFFIPSNGGLNNVEIKLIGDVVLNTGKIIYFCLE